MLALKSNEFNLEEKEQHRIDSKELCDANQQTNIHAKFQWQIDGQKKDVVRKLFQAINVEFFSEWHQHTIHAHINKIKTSHLTSYFILQLRTTQHTHKRGMQIINANCINKWHVLRCTDAMMVNWLFDISICVPSKLCTQSVWNVCCKSWS